MAKGPKQNLKRGRRQCIFCRNFGVSKEHVFPDWLKKLFRRDDSTTHTYGTIDESQIIGIPRINEKHRSGHAGSNTVRVVCEHCNSGWLSQLELRTKPFLIPLILGERVEMTPEFQKAIALWAAKTAMTAEMVRPRENGITQTEKSFLKNRLLPPPNWIIWVAGYAGGRWRELGMGQHRGQITASPIPRPNRVMNYIQATTLGMGHIVFLIVSTNWKSAPKTFARFDGNGFYQICPPRPRSILWPPARLLNDPQINEMANILNLSGAFDNSLNPLANWRFAM